MRQSSEDLANFYQDPKGPFLEYKGSWKRRKKETIKENRSFREAAKGEGIVSKVSLGIHAF